jgi:hypothetical protein
MLLKREDFTKWTVVIRASVPTAIAILFTNGSRFGRHHLNMSAVVRPL